jgi:hypothetical protein
MQAPVQTLCEQFLRVPLLCATTSYSNMEGMHRASYPKGIGGFPSQNYNHSASPCFSTCAIRSMDVNAFPSAYSAVAWW